ncbi:hypothetical protein CLD20_00375 [Afifella sp. IM 167]|nr:hypothetical protein [Afifella sp. IM 167]
MASPALAQDFTPEQETALGQAARQLGGEPTREQFLAFLTEPIRRKDRNGDGFDIGDVAAEIDAEEATARAVAIGRILAGDLDGDFEVTRAEVQALQRLQKGDLVARRFDEVDKDGNGVVTLREIAEDFQEGGVGIRSTGGTAAILMALDPDRDGRLTLAEAGEVTERFFSSYDTDGDGVMSRRELSPLASATQARLQLARQEIEKVREEREARAVCGAPKAEPDQKVMLIGAYEAAAISSVFVGSPEEETGTVPVHVEPGKTPLYVLATSYQPVIWQFDGAVERVATVVVGGRASGGVAGIAEDRVHFLEAEDCLPYTYKPRSVEGVLVRRKAAAIAGVDDVEAAGDYALAGVSLPDMTLAPRVSGNAGDGPPVTRISSPAVVANAKVGVYEVLPGPAGVAQLVASGHLVKLRGHKEYRLVKPIPYLPARLTGAHSINLVVAPGVPRPKGNPGHSCIVMEKTGETIGLTPSCR